MTSELALTVRELSYLTRKWEVLHSDGVVTKRGPERGFRLDNDQHSQVPDSMIPTDTTNVLHTLPVEILNMIFAEMDIMTLMQLRAVSWHVRALMGHSSAYSAIAKHAPDALRAMLYNGTAAYYTVQDLFVALCSEKCWYCARNFAPFLDVLICARRCHRCPFSRNDPARASMACTTVTKAKDCYRLNAAAMRKLPTCSVLPGYHYTGIQMTYRETLNVGSRGLSLVNTKLIKKMLCEQGSRCLTASGIRDIKQLAASTSSISMGNIWSDWADLTEESIASRRRKSFEPATMLHIPVLDPKAGLAHWDVLSCVACSERLDRTAFCSEGRFLKHYQNCKLSQAMRKHIPGEDSAPRGFNEFRLMLRSKLTNDNYSSDPNDVWEV